MTRRQAVRLATLFSVGMTLEKFDAVMSAKSGLLTVNLNDWHSVDFTLGGKVVSVPVAEIFRALQEGQR
jgi:hypothetical protein